MSSLTELLSWANAATGLLWAVVGLSIYAFVTAAKRLALFVARSFAGRPKKPAPQPRLPTPERHLLTDFTQTDNETILRTRLRYKKPPSPHRLLINDPLKPHANLETAL